MVEGPLRIFIGFDPQEAVAYHTLAHSILRRSSIPVEISPLARCNLKDIYKRPRGQYESTDFSLTRFLVPYLCDYKGWALYMDCDMLMRTDIAELASALDLSSYWKTLFCVKHEYTPNPNTKFLDQPQTIYARKNWSSFMLFNCYRCKKLTPEYVDRASGIALHQFEWVEDDGLIGELEPGWNWLVGEYDEWKASGWYPDVRNVHFTRGGPWFPGYADCDFADEWRAEFADMTSPVTAWPVSSL